MTSQVRWRTPGALLASSIVLSACAFTQPIPARDMALGDGVRVELSEDISAENLMILTRGQGERGHLLGAVANRSDRTVQVSIDPGGGGAFTIDAPARSKVNLTHAGLVIEAVAMAPGATQPTTVSSPATGAFAVEVPVLDGTLPHYDRFLNGVEGRV
ncbi:hypothetical protein Q9R32_10075 [Actinotalea sp. AC32]|nr:hypothetical protein [Actinotalea sp. AC32]